MTDFRAKGTIMGPAGLTAVFGMGTGGAPRVSSPESGREEINPPDRVEVWFAIEINPVGVTLHSNKRARDGEQAGRTEATHFRSRIESNCGPDRGDADLVDRSIGRVMSKDALGLDHRVDPSRRGPSDSESTGQRGWIGVVKRFGC